MAAFLRPSHLKTNLLALGVFAFSFFGVIKETLSNPAGLPSVNLSVNNCAEHIAQYEKQHNIPEGLLQAMSKVESGRKDDTGHIVAWPWTVNAEGQGYYFPTKEAAIIAVRKMQLQGIKSIDVGCMQVNLYHHPNAFRTLEDAFEPSKNVAYAARFLTGLKNTHASWNLAVAHYHSANPSHHIPYHKNVMGVWTRDIKEGNLSLTAGVFNSLSARQLPSPQVNRIRRLTKGKTLALRKGLFYSASSRSPVKKVVRVSSSHIRRLSSAKLYKVSHKLSKTTS